MSTDRDVKTARQHLLARRRYFIEQLAHGPVVVDDLIRWLFDTQRAIEVLDKVEADISAMAEMSSPTQRELIGEDPTHQRELYSSSNDDRWFLVRQNGNVFIRHAANRSSGGRRTDFQIGPFLDRGQGPEQQELLRLIGTLVDIPPAGSVPLLPDSP
jgi:hypothetical protein